MEKRPASSYSVKELASILRKLGPKKIAALLDVLRKEYAHEVFYIHICGTKHHSSDK